MKPGISEFSYGYAVTEELLNFHLKAVPRIGAPTLPSLTAESTRGYDLKIRFVHSMLFLQFKLSDCMVGGKVLECANQGAVPPFHRFYIHSRKQSRQHQLLLQLESVQSSIPKLVFYVAPQFHKPGELDKFYARKQVANRSVFVPPSLIGAFYDHDSDTVAFKSPSGPLLINSEPRTVDEAVGVESLRRIIAVAGRDRASIGDSGAVLDLARVLNSIVLEEGVHPDIDVASSTLARDEPLAVVGHLARNYFWCEAVAIGTVQ